MTQVQDATWLMSKGLTPPKPRLFNPDTSSLPFRITVECAVNKKGVIQYRCPYCGNPQAFRPPEWACPSMVVSVQTICCDRPAVLALTGRTDA